MDRKRRSPARSPEYNPGLEDPDEEDFFDERSRKQRGRSQRSGSASTTRRIRSSYSEDSPRWHRFSDSWDDYDYYYEDYDDLDLGDPYDRLFEEH
ncbi:MAG: hypothetical protein OER80_14780 [Gammaproteobacteria bacterium]|nr:hypothetical protein [Gammaproteobacteria bacterium]